MGGDGPEGHNLFGRFWFFHRTAQDRDGGSRAHGFGSEDQQARRHIRDATPLGAESGRLRRGGRRSSPRTRSFGTDGAENSDQGSAVYPDHAHSRIFVPATPG